MTRIHHLKARPESFNLIRDQIATFQVRRFDREFRRGDVVVLREWSRADGYTGRWAARVVGFLQEPGTPGLIDGFGAFAITTEGLVPRLRNAGGPALVNGTGLTPQETVPAPGETSAA